MTEIAEKAHELAVEAKQEVAEVKANLGSHEDICGLRYSTITTTMQEIKSMQKDQDEKMDRHLSKIYGKAWTAIIAVLVVFVTIAGIMATYIMTQTEDRIDSIEEVRHANTKVQDRYL